MFCESDPAAVDVLRRCMASGHIPQAPIHPNVRNLTKADLEGIGIV